MQRIGRRRLGQNLLQEGGPGGLGVTPDPSSSSSPNEALSKSSGSSSISSTVYGSAIPVSSVDKERINENFCKHSKANCPFTAYGKGIKQTFDRLLTS